MIRNRIYYLFLLAIGAALPGYSQPENAFFTEYRIGYNSQISLLSNFKNNNFPVSELNNTQINDRPCVDVTKLPAGEISLKYPVKSAWNQTLSVDLCKDDFFLKSSLGFVRESVLLSSNNQFLPADLVRGNFSYPSSFSLDKQQLIFRSLLVSEQAGFRQSYKNYETSVSIGGGILLFLSGRAITQILQNQQQQYFHSTDPIVRGDLKQKVPVFICTEISQGYKLTKNLTVSAGLGTFSFINFYTSAKFNGGFDRFMLNTGILYSLKK